MLKKPWMLLAALGAIDCRESRAEPDATQIAASDPAIAVMGRVDASDAERLRFGYPGVTLRLRFEGSSIALKARSTSAQSRLGLRIDGGAERVVALELGRSEVLLSDQLPPGVHTIELVHRTETWQGIISVEGFVLSPGARLLPPEPWPARRLLFIGDSVTCGEAIDRRVDCRRETDASNAAASYGMLLARSLDAQCHLVSYGGRGLVRDWQGKSDVLNAPQFFELAVAEDGSIAWDHASYQPDLVLVSLGTNDFYLALGPLPARAEFVAAYVKFVRNIRARHPRAYVVLTEGAIVNDHADPARPQKRTLRAYIEETVRVLADPKVEFVGSEYYPGDRCDSHPTREQHAAMAADWEPVLRRKLGW